MARARSANLAAVCRRCFTPACAAPPAAGSGPFSTVRWNPFGRFFALAGFGNLPGDLVFYDKKMDGKCRQMGATR